LEEVRDGGNAKEVQKGPLLEDFCNFWKMTISSAKIEQAERMEIDSIQILHFHLLLSINHLLCFCPIYSLLFFSFFLSYNS